MKLPPSAHAALSLLTAVLLAAAAAGCGTTTAVPRPFPVPGAPRTRALPPAIQGEPAGGDSIARTALSLTGIPYRLGGSDPQGFDCSGLVQYVFALHGIAVPRVVEQQVQLGRKVREDEIAAGDLIFFKVDSRRPSHVGIAIDGLRFVHAPRTGTEVRVDGLDSPYWRARYAQVRRVEAAASGGPMLTLRDEAP